MSHVLIIDDSERVRDTVKAMLESAGFTVSVATDGEDGVKQFQQERFDLVISDVVMPRKDGLETIREIRKVAAHIPIIAMSSGTHAAGTGGTEDAACYGLSLAEDSGATRTIRKPFSRDNLLAVIRECMMEGVGQIFD
jgi:DNA-binding response OmpR family regulator